MPNVSMIDGHIDEPKKVIKCTGERCPMQVGYDVANCQCEGCSYRTAPTTNYDRIRNMSVEEMAELFTAMYHEEYIKMTTRLHENGIDCSLVELDHDSQVAIHKNWLESEVTE